MLVYNVADDDSFAYVRTMREQILAYRATSQLSKQTSRQFIE